MHFRQKISFKRALEIFTPVSGHLRTAVKDYFQKFYAVEMNVCYSFRVILYVVFELYTTQSWLLYWRNYHYFTIRLERKYHIMQFLISEL